MKISHVLSMSVALAIACGSPLISNAQVPATMLSTKTSVAQKMVTITSPAPAAQINNGSTTVSLHLAATADPSSLKIVANEKDVTSQFDIASCASPPCEISARLNLYNGVVGGWNYLTATVIGPGGSADSARARFFSTTGEMPASRNVSRQLATAADVPIFPYNYYPPFSVHMYTAQNGLICVASYCNSTPYIWLMDRRTLTVTQTGVDPSVLPTLDSNTIVIVNLPGTAAQTIDFSSVGGTNFTTQGAPVPYNYTMVGYGGAQSARPMSVITATQTLLGME